MNTIDQSKFRFKIGDEIIFGEGVTTVLGYYFSNGFNNFNNAYGYVIRAPKTDGHPSSNRSYNSKGEHIISDSCYHIIEKDAYPSYFSKLKPGDKIRVKDKLRDSLEYQLSICSAMYSLLEHVFTIKHIRRITPILNYNYPSYYHIEVDENTFIWSDKMVEKVSESESKNLFKDLNIFSKISVAFKSSKKSDNDLYLIIKKKKPKLNFKV